MVRKASKLKQRQRQSQKQIVNITLAKEPKRKAVKRRVGKGTGTSSAQPQQNYTGGFNPVYIQSGNLAEQNINPLIKTIEELKESIKAKPDAVPVKQLVMRTPMKPLEYETGFDFTQDKFKNKVDFIEKEPTRSSQAEIVKPAFIPQRLEKAGADDTPLTLGIGRMVEAINPAFSSEPIITQAEIIRTPPPADITGLPATVPIAGKGKGKGGGKGRLPKADTEDEARYKKEKKAYDKAVSNRKKEQEKAQREGREYKIRKKLIPPVPPSSVPPSNFPYDL